MVELTRRIKCCKCAGEGTVEVSDGDKLRQVREQAGVSLRSVAKKLKLSAPFVSDVELNRRQANNEIMSHYRKLKAHPRMAVEVRNGK